MSAEQDRKKDHEEAYRQAFAAFGSWQTQARADLMATTKNAWTARDLQYMKKVMPEREIMSFNRLRPLVRLMSNFERMNRMSIRYSPTEGGDVLTASELTTCANHALAHQKGYYIKSDCFDHSLKTGMSLFNLAMDRNQNVIFEKYGQGFSGNDTVSVYYMSARGVVSEARQVVPPGARDNRSRSIKDEPSGGILGWLRRMSSD